MKKKSSEYRADLWIVIDKPSGDFYTVEIKGDTEAGDPEVFKLPMIFKTKRRAEVFAIRQPNAHVVPCSLEVYLKNTKHPIFMVAGEK